MHLVWIRSDAATLRHRLAARGLARDSAKKAGFATFTASMRLGTEPAVPHLAIDNRLAAVTSLADQVARLIARLPGPPGWHVARLDGRSVAPAGAYARDLAAVLQVMRATAGSGRTDAAPDRFAQQRQCDRQIDKLVG